MRKSLLEIGISRVVAEGELEPGASLRTAAKGQARFTDFSEDRGVIATSAGPGTLDQPFQTIVVVCSLGVGARGLGVAGEAESLAEPSLRIPVFRSRLEGQPELKGGGLAITLDQGQPAAEHGHGGSVVSTRAGTEQTFHTGRLTPVKRNPRTGDARFEICLRQGLERGAGLV